MKLLATFNTSDAAHLALSRLQSAGIAATMPDDLTVAPYGDVGGVRILVADEDLESARAILEMKPKRKKS